MKRLMLALVVASLAMPSVTASSQASASATKLKQDMRKLWTDHVVWTRDYVVAAVADHPSAKSSAARLLKNQEDIGNAIGSIYGAPAGTELTRLLKEHITIAVDVVKAAKAGDKGALSAADAKWQQNGDAIAAFLAKANPNLARNVVADMMKMHLSTTTAEVVARLGKDWDGDVRAFDAVYNHILVMADALSDAIVKQFPDRFRALP